MSADALSTASVDGDDAAWPPRVLEEEEETMDTGRLQLATCAAHPAARDEGEAGDEADEDEDEDDDDEVTHNHTVHVHAFADPPGNTADIQRVMQLMRWPQGNPDVIPVLRAELKRAMLHGQAVGCAPLENTMLMARILQQEGDPTIADTDGQTVLATIPPSKWFAAVICFIQRGFHTSLLHAMRMRFLSVGHFIALNKQRGGHRMFAVDGRVPVARRKIQSAKGKRSKGVLWTRLRRTVNGKTYGTGLVDAPQCPLMVESNMDTPLSAADVEKIEANALSMWVAKDGRAYKITWCIVEAIKMRRLNCLNLLLLLLYNNHVDGRERGTVFPESHGGLRMYAWSGLLDMNVMLHQAVVAEWPEGLQLLQTIANAPLRNWDTDQVLAFATARWQRYVNMVRSIDEGGTAPLTRDQALAGTQRLHACMSVLAPRLAVTNYQSTPQLITKAVRHLSLAMHRVDMTMQMCAHGSPSDSHPDSHADGTEAGRPGRITNSDANFFSSTCEHLRLLAMKVQTAMQRSNARRLREQTQALHRAWSDDVAIDTSAFALSLADAPASAPGSMHSIPTASNTSAEEGIRAVLGEHMPPWFKQTHDEINTMQKMGGTHIRSRRHPYMNEAKYWVSTFLGRTPDRVRDDRTVYIDVDAVRLSVVKSMAANRRAPKDPSWGSVPDSDSEAEHSSAASSEEAGTPSLVRSPRTGSTPPVRTPPVRTKGDANAIRRYRKELRDEIAKEKNAKKGARCRAMERKARRRTRRMRTGPLDFMGSNSSTLSDNEAEHSHLPLPRPSHHAPASVKLSPTARARAAAASAAAASSAATATSAPRAAPPTPPQWAHSLHTPPTPAPRTPHASTLSTHQPSPQQRLHRPASTPHGPTPPRTWRPKVVPRETAPASSRPPKHRKKRRRYPASSVALSKTFRSFLSHVPQPHAKKQRTHRRSSSTYDSGTIG